MEDGPIHLDTEFAKEIGFTSDKFIDSWLWYTENQNKVTLSMIISKDPGKGNVKRLIDNLKEKFNVIEIPCPSARMTMIAEKSGFSKVLLPPDYNDPYDLGACPGMKWVKVKEAI